MQGSRNQLLRTEIIGNQLSIFIYSEREVFKLFFFSTTPKTTLTDQCKIR